MIRTENLTKIYRNQSIETPALREVNLAIEEGEFVSVLGPSGAGKTSLLNIFGLLDTPTSGQYWLKGQKVDKLSDFQRANMRKGRIGYVFENFNLIKELTISENIELPLIYMHKKASERRKMVKDIMTQFNISHRGKCMPTELSGLQLQKASIARALIANPELILADEPTGNLDSVSGSEILDLFTEINNKGVTIVMVTHSVTNADKANRVIQLFDGYVLSKNLLRAI